MCQVLYKYTDNDSPSYEVFTSVWIFPQSTTANDTLIFTSSVGPTVPCYKHDSLATHKPPSPKKPQKLWQKGLRTVISPHLVPMAGYMHKFSPCLATGWGATRSVSSELALGSRASPAVLCFALSRGQDIPARPCWCNIKP